MASPIGAFATENRALPRKIFFVEPVQSPLLAILGLALRLDRAIPIYHFFVPEREKERTREREGSIVIMREKRDPSSQEHSRRDPRAARYYDERMPRHKSKPAGPQDDRDRDSTPAKHRSTPIRPHERERERDSISYYQSRSGHVSKLMSSEEAQKAIRTLYMVVKEAEAFFVDFKREYQKDVRGIEAYAGQTILEKLWERKIKHNDSKRHPSKGRSRDDSVGSRSTFSDVSNRLWDALNNAYGGARSSPSAQNDSLARKLDIAINEFSGLLSRVRTYSQQIDSLIQELILLKTMLKLGGAGKVSQDDRADRQPGARGHPKISSQEREDAQYGGTGEGSGSEDDGREDEHHGEHSSERDENEAGGDEGGQGILSHDQSM